jgi:GT2 family glycosyltransferase
VTDKSIDTTVDILIPIYGALDMLRNAVESIDAFTDWPYRLWLFDDCTASPEMDTYLNSCAEWGCKVVRSTRRRGFREICSWAINDHLKGPYFLLFNSDVMALPGWLPPMMRWLIKEATVAVVGPKLLFPPEKGQKEAFRIQHIGVARRSDGLPYHPFRGEPARIPIARHARDVNCVTGACMLVRRQAWDDVGGFDSRFIFGQYEDVDFNWRLRKKRWRVIMEPGSVLFHYEHGSGESHVGFGQVNRPILLERWKHLTSDEEEIFGIKRPT